MVRKSTTRKGISKRVRFEVFKRDGFICQYCGRKTPDVILEVDHVMPVAEGGTNHDTNLVTSCYDCNRGKGAKNLTSVPASLSERIAAQKELADQVAKYNELSKSIRSHEDSIADELGRYWCDLTNPDQKGEWTVSESEERSIRVFIRRLLSSEIKEAMEIAVEARPPGVEVNGTSWDVQTWKYFCGVCWNKIKSRR